MVVAYQWCCPPDLGCWGVEWLILCMADLYGADLATGMLTAALDGLCARRCWPVLLNTDCAVCVAAGPKMIWMQQVGIKAVRAYKEQKNQQQPRPIDPTGEVVQPNVPAVFWVLALLIQWDMLVVFVARWYLLTCGFPDEEPKIRLGFLQMPSLRLMRLSPSGSPLLYETLLGLWCLLRLGSFADMAVASDATDLLFWAAVGSFFVGSMVPVVMVLPLCFLNLVQGNRVRLVTEDDWPLLFELCGVGVAYWRVVEVTSLLQLTVLNLKYLMELKWQSPAGADGCGVHLLEFSSCCSSCWKMSNLEDFVLPG
ncbi:hypothetical protein Nepgr_022914 [Nepenthes gracilis]|uniref:Uncharacterized protein n=1 Tax=Nepenthes gracilis TaxID=150966 RepID=A0AAD3XX88_NEPGR|nr:hypothetical protein Nepgr_022914 [Nepenthes gracilis]